MTSLIPIILSLLACCTLATAEAQIVLFKLDDVSGVSQKYERVADFALQEGIKINFGVFGSALEKDPAALVAWIDTLKKTGSFEFWNHGYGGFGKGKENEGTGYEAQLTTITRTQELSKQHLGEAFIGFGPHASGVDADTWKVLNDLPEIRLVWGYQPPAGMTGNAFVVERKLNMENPTTKMNKAKFFEAYEKKGKTWSISLCRGTPTPGTTPCSRSSRTSPFFSRARAVAS